MFNLRRESLHEYKFWVIELTHSFSIFHKKMRSVLIFRRLIFSGLAYLITYSVMSSFNFKVDGSSITLINYRFWIVLSLNNKLFIVNFYTIEFIVQVVAILWNYNFMWKEQFIWKRCHYFDNQHQIQNQIYKLDVASTLSSLLTVRITCLNQASVNSRSITP